MTSQDAIRQRSYLIWQREGRPSGKALDHWLLAQAELEAETHDPHPAMAFSHRTVAPRPPISALPQKVVAKRIPARDGVSAATQ